MGILHELLVTIGVILLLVIGWSLSITVHEALQEPGITMNAVSQARACHGNTCELRERG